MNQKARRYITILLTIVFCACAFSAAAFAETNGGEESGDETSESASVSSDQSSSSPSSDVFIPATIQITLIYDNGEQTEVKTVNAGTSVSGLPAPSREGYKFAGWTSGGKVLPSSAELTDGAVLTASWNKIAVSSARPASRPVQSSQKPVDTRQSEIEALASEAEQATSDPGVLDSQDWSELLSSAPDESSSSPAQESGVSSAAEQTTSGGFSWLFAVGVALIVFALGGIGLFVYLQFFSGPRGGGKGPGGGPGKKDDDTVVFTDVSSFSEPSGHSGSGRNPDLDDTIPLGPKPVPPAEKSGGPASAPDADSLDAPSGMSQAKPVNGEKSSFDWEKFFDDDK